MTERSTRTPLPSWLWPILLLAALALGLLLDGAIPQGQLQVANPDAERVVEVEAAIAQLPEDPLVLVAMDPDLGTYPEIRGAARSALDALLRDQARVAVISFTPEGRAVAVAEVERLRAGAIGGDRLLDLGFVAGAEAGMVLSVTDIDPSEAGTHPPEFSRISGGIANVDLVLVIGGVDIGPRTWVEQVATRVPQVPIIAVVPTFMLPEVAPYLRTGQLEVLLGTLRDDAAYTESIGTVAEAPSPLAMLVGMLIGLAFIGRGLYAVRRGGAAPSTSEAEEPA